MIAESKPVLKLVSAECQKTEDYYLHRRALALTASELRQHGMRAAESFSTAFSIVGEDIGDNQLRRRLQAFFIGNSGVSLVTPVRPNLYCGASRRIYSGLPTARLRDDQKTKSAVSSEPLATYLIRSNLPYQPSTMTLDEQETHAGALIRSLAQPLLQTFNYFEAAQATQSLLPELDADLQLSLGAVWAEYRYQSGFAAD